MNMSVSWPSYAASVDNAQETTVILPQPVERGDGGRQV
jgi:hypothetical protein